MINNLFDALKLEMNEWLEWANAWNVSLDAHWNERTKHKQKEKIYKTKTVNSIQIHGGRTVQQQHS